MDDSSSNFSQQNYAGDESGLPRIIGGRDLVVFSSRSGNVEDWMEEVQAVSTMTTTITLL